MILVLEDKSVSLFSIDTKTVPVALNSFDIKMTLLRRQRVTKNLILQVFERNNRSSLG